MLSKDDVLSVAKLSRLKLTEEENAKFLEQLSEVLQLFEKVKNINTESVAETSQVTGLKNVIRCDELACDECRRPCDSDELLKNTPIKEGSNIVVPKVMPEASSRALQKNQQSFQKVEGSE